MARLVITDGSSTRNVELTDATTVAGRAPENKIVIDDKQASRRHFTIDRIEYGFKVVDLESRNGTRVNDRQVNQHFLRPGDKITIGKHVLTFEDPNFREPPAEVAARLSPATASVPVKGVEAPSTSPDSSPAAPLPVATEAPRPAPAPAASLPPLPTEDYRSRRNRSGHTTAVQKNVQVQLREEQKTLTMVAIGAGVFIFVILVLIFLPSSPSGGATEGGTKPVTGIPKVDPAELAAKEAEAWDELSTYCERNKNTATAYPDIIKRADEFEKNHPRSPNGAKAREYRSAAVNGIKTSKNAAFTEAEKQAQDDLKRNDFAGALRKIRELLVKYKTDADIHERLAKLKDQTIEEAKSYFRTKTVEADAMKFSRKDEAREVYQSLLKVMGNGTVPELDDYCKICRVSIEGLQ